MYDTTGVLLVLAHWRTPGQATWIPLLDTKLLSRLASGRKTETYWPVAVADGKFHCIILKGGDKYPYFPRPLLSEFDFQIPTSSAPIAENEDEMELTDQADSTKKLEQQYLLKGLEASLYSDLVENTSASNSQRAELGKKEVEVDKVLLQLIAAECMEGEERGMKALELVGLLSGEKMVEAAVKIASRYGRSVLEQKIREVAEQRLMAMDDDDD